jgi:uncharacterized membrane protein (DUF2068 family)
MTDSEPQPRQPSHRNRWLILIAIFKLAQALLFASLAIGAIHLLRTSHLLHVDVADLLSDLADRLQFNSESRLVNFLLNHAAFIDDKLLLRIEAAGFIYAVLDTVEGVGLYLEKTWAEYLTLLITGSFLPLELWEVIHRHSIFSIVLLVANALVFLYLLLLVARSRRRRCGQSVLS